MTEPHIKDLTTEEKKQLFDELHTKTRRAIRRRVQFICVSTLISLVALWLFYDVAEVAKQMVGLFLLSYPVSAVITLFKILWDLRAKRQ